MPHVPTQTIELRARLLLPCFHPGCTTGEHEYRAEPVPATPASLAERSRAANPVRTIR